MIEDRQQREGWGSAVIPRLSAELRNELPELKGFSERNIKRMLTFHRAYPAPDEFMPQAAAQISAGQKSTQLVAKKGASEKVPQAAAQLPESLLWSIPWFHHVARPLGPESNRRRCMSRDWPTYLDDILECCQRVRSYTAGLDQAGLVGNQMAYDAVLRNLEIVGEAAKSTPTLIGEWSRTSYPNWNARSKLSKAAVTYEQEVQR